MGACGACIRKTSCQALGIAPEYKYHHEGGPSLVDCFALVRRTTRPAALHLPRLLDQVLFNTLLGNHDAHGKNYSLIYGPDGTTLAPLYDVVSTAVYPELTAKMAMKIGGRLRIVDLIEARCRLTRRRFAERKPSSAS